MNDSAPHRCLDHRRLVTRLFVNGLRYRARRLSGRSSPLQSISLELTHRCICRCQMCNIWQVPREIPDLDLEFWIGVLASPQLGELREIDLTGGEPFLRDDLPELLRWICRVRPERFPALRTVAITTNGLLTERILGTVAKLIVPLQRQGIDLVFALGMDGVGAVHDRIRGVPGAWERLAATLAGLEELRTAHPNLVPGLKTTVVPHNVGELAAIARFAESHRLFAIISPYLITANRFGNTDLADRLAFSAADREALTAFFAGPHCAWSAHADTVGHYLASGRVDKPCAAGFTSLFVRHTGEVYPCPLIPAALGNLRDAPLAALLDNAAARAFRRRIGRYAECRCCTEPGLERLAWPAEGFACLRWRLRAGAERFDRLAAHMGLDKLL